jgi:hypothetical protein
MRNLFLRLADGQQLQPEAAGGSAQPNPFDVAGFTPATAFPAEPL